MRTHTTTDPNAGPSPLPSASYPVRLTVSDAEGLQDTASTQLEVRDAPPPPEPTGVDFRAAAQSNQNLTQPSVPVPDPVRTGDTVLLIVSTNRDVAATLPAGWTPVATRADSELRSRVFSRIATSDTAGSRIRVTLGSQSKAALGRGGLRGCLGDRVRGVGHPHHGSGGPPP